MKIIFQSYNTCCQNISGGVQVRMRQVAGFLQHSIEVEFFNPFASDIRTCDILHVFKADAESYALIKYAKEIGKKVVISTIMPLVSGLKIDIYRNLCKLPIATTYRQIIEIIRIADALIVETEKEAEFLKKHFRISGDSIKIIPNGIMEEIYEGEEIYSYVDKEKKYVLQVGRFDPNKNQLNIIRAMKNTEIDVVFIGGSDTLHPLYYNQCIKEASNCNNFHFLGWRDSASGLLKSAYSNATVVVLPSYYETFGLVAIEGGMFGANLVLSETLPILDYPVFKNCSTINPKSVVDIRNKITDSIACPKTEFIKKGILSTFSWNRIIEAHLECYSKLLC